MYRFTSNDAPDLDELRERLRKMTDSELLRFGIDSEEITRRLERIGEKVEAIAEAETRRARANEAKKSPMFVYKPNSPEKMAGRARTGTNSPLDSD